MLNPAADTLSAMLADVKTIAVLGAKDVAGQPVDKVGRYLMERGYNVIPVHPKRQNVWGLPTYPSLADVPPEAGPVDCVDLFRAAQFCPAHAQEALGLSPTPKLFWMQSGIASPEARAALEPRGVTVVENECLMVFLRSHSV